MNTTSDRPYKCGGCNRDMDEVDDYAWMCVRCKKQVYWFQTEDLPDPDVRKLLQREWESGYDSLPDEERDAS